MEAGAADQLRRRLTGRVDRQMSSHDLHVHGEWPDLDGLICSGLVVEEWWYEGSIYDPAMVIWLQAESTWHRLVMEYGEVFWRVADDEPTAYDLPELRGSTRIVDLGRNQGLIGEVISGIDGQDTEEGVEVVVQFKSGRLIRFRNTGETNSYYTV